jgi:hypothetical protein
MKAFKNIVIAVSTIAIFFISGCSKDDETSTRNEQLRLLTASAWSINSITVDGVDQSSLFTNMTVSFAESEYETSGGSEVWPASGTWRFKQNNSNVIIIDNDIEMTIVNLDESTLKISFQWNHNTFGTGRAKSIAGFHEFTFTH